ncbi:MAG: NINE protein [Mycobacterium leprae]
MGVAYVLLLALGGLGVHRLYLGDNKGLLYAGAAVATATLLQSGPRAAPGQRAFMIAGICLVWLILLGLVTDLFTLPAQVDRANRRIRRDLLNRMAERTDPE